MPAACGSVVGRQSSCVWEEGSRDRPVHCVCLFLGPGAQAMQSEGGSGDVSRYWRREDEGG